MVAMVSWQRTGIVGLGICLIIFGISRVEGFFRPEIKMKRHRRTYRSENSANVVRFANLIGGSGSVIIGVAILIKYFPHR